MFPLNDIAIIELDDDIKYDEKMRNIVMADKEETVENFALAYVDTTGWGRTCFNCDRSDILFKTTLAVVTNNNCRRDFHNITFRHICAIDENLSSTSK